MKRTPLPLFEGFIETPFEQRFQGLLRQAWKLKRWHVIVAEPGSGKTMGIRDLSAQASREAGMIGGRRYPVLAVTAPKNDAKEAALGNGSRDGIGAGSAGPLERAQIPLIRVAAAIWRGVPGHRRCS
jgi:hypothetical protein